MKKVVIGIVVAILVVGGAYLIFHKSSKPTAASTTTSNAPAVNNAALLTKTNASVGQYLTDPNGNALYTYGADTSGVSNCSRSCLVAWPAYQDKGSTTNLPTGVGTIKRTDNSQIQYTYMGMPLYYFTSDSQGQVTGNGVQGFQVAKPSATTTTTSTPTTNSTTNSTTSTSNTSSGYNY